jgi:hypothetical protein
MTATIAIVRLYQCLIRSLVLTSRSPPDDRLCVQRHSPTVAPCATLSLPVADLSHD